MIKVEKEKKEKQKGKIVKIDIEYIKSNLEYRNLETNPDGSIST